MANIVLKGLLREKHYFPFTRSIRMMTMKLSLTFVALQVHWLNYLVMNFVVAFDLAPDWVSYAQPSWQTPHNRNHKSHLPPYRKDSLMAARQKRYWNERKKREIYLTEYFPGTYIGWLWLFGKVSIWLQLPRCPLFNPAECLGLRSDQAFCLASSSARSTSPNGAINNSQ